MKSAEERHNDVVEQHISDAEHQDALSTWKKEQQGVRICNVQYKQSQQVVLRLVGTHPYEGSQLRGKSGERLEWMA